MSEPVLGLTSATLDLRLAAAHLDLRSAELGEVLLLHAGHRPALSVDRNRGRVRARQSYAWTDWPHQPSVETVLNGRLPWALRVRAGAMSGWLDLRRLRLVGLDVSASDAQLRADLPAPAGAVLLRIGGRGLDATLSVPAGATVRFWQEHGWQVEGDRGSGPVPLDRYDVWLEGRGGRCRVETRRTEVAAPRPRVLT